MSVTSKRNRPASEPAATIDQWFERQNREVDRIHRSIRLKRLRNRSVIDEVELSLRIARRIAKEEAEFVDAVLLARMVARIHATDDDNYGFELITEAWNDVAAWFREMHARCYGEGVPINRNVPGQAAAFKEHESNVRREINDKMLAELEAGKDGSALEQNKQWNRKSDIKHFADNLELARVIYARHPKLVTAMSFPEPYRAAIIESEDYDPEKEPGVDIDDLHITDPVQAELEWERRARESLARLAARVDHK